jgi:DNA gyrase subunit A
VVSVERINEPEGDDEAENGNGEDAADDLPDTPENEA